MASVGQVFVDIAANTKELFSGLRQAKGAVDKFSRDAGKSFEKMPSSIGKGMKGVGESFLEFSTKAIAWIGGIGVAFEGLKTSAEKGFEVNMNIENAQIAFTTLLKSGAKAKEMIQQLQEMGVKSPFNFESLSKSAKLLLSMGVDAKNVVPWMQKIGDAVAAVGGSSEQMELVSLAIAQIAAKGKVSAEEMNQLAENGIPAWQILSEKMHLSTAELMKMGQNGKLFSKDVLPKLIDGLGDRFGGAMQKASTTFSGQLEQMKEKSDLIFGKIFEPAFNSAKEVMPKINKELDDLMAQIKQKGVSEGLIRFFTPKSVADDLVLANNAVSQIIDAAKKGDWEQVGRLFVEGIKNYLDAQGDMTQFIINQLQKVDWKQVGHALGQFLYGALDQSLKDMNLKDLFAAIFPPALQPIGPQLAQEIGSFPDTLKTVLPQKLEGLKQIIIQKLAEILAGGIHFGASMKTYLTNKWSEIKTSAQNIWAGITQYLSGKWQSIVGTASAKWQQIKNNIIKPIEDAWHTITGIVHKIESAFNNMHISIPKPHLPKVNVSWKTVAKGLASAVIPVFSFFAKGGIVDGATPAIIGEAGPEAVIPLSGQSKMRPFAQAIANELGGAGKGGHNITVNNYTNDKRVGYDIARAVERELWKHAK